MTKTNKPFFEVITASVGHPKHRLGKSQKRAHSKNGKISFTTTMTVEDYDWLVQESSLTGMSASTIISHMILLSKSRGSVNRLQSYGEDSK
jgi:hypothetical protein